MGTSRSFAFPLPHRLRFAANAAECVARGGGRGGKRTGPVRKVRPAALVRDAGGWTLRDVPVGMLRIRIPSAARPEPCRAIGAPSDRLPSRAICPSCALRRHHRGFVSRSEVGCWACASPASKRPRPKSATRRYDSPAASVVAGRVPGCYFFGKSGEFLTSSICSRCRSVWAGTMSITWYTLKTVPVGAFT